MRGRAAGAAELGGARWIERHRCVTGHHRITAPSIQSTQTHLVRFLPETDLLLTPPARER
jgi:hypothetical protein